MSIKNTIRKVAFNHLSDKSIENFYKIYYRLRYPNEMEKEKSFGGLNTDKTIYIIRPRTDCTEGLMSLYINVLKNLEYGISKGYTCLVDFKNYKTQYFDPLNPSQNIWDLFFTQPSSIKLEDAYHSKNVILSGLNINWYNSNIFNNKFDDYKVQHDFAFKYIDFSKDVKSAVDHELLTIGIKSSELIGLYLRGTDYVALKPSGHPIQPTPYQGIEIVDSYLKKHPDIKGIFLVTEDYSYYQIIKNYYKQHCYIASFDKFITNYDGKTFLSHESSINELGTSAYQRGLNYLVKLIILSKCRYIVGGRTMGTRAVLLFSGKKNNAYIFDLGNYGK